MHMQGLKNPLAKSFQPAIVEIPPHILMSFRVVKRDKQIEDFNEAKIVNVLESCGISHEEAQQFSVRIFQWVTDTKKPLVTTLQIRDRIITELQKMNREAAEHYIQYEINRDKTIGGPNT